MNTIATQISQTSHKTKIGYLEGLRGLAAFLVLLHHLKNSFFISPQENIELLLNSLYLPEVVTALLTNIFLLFFDSGRLAVWIFWVLSSYVISIAFFKRNKNYDSLVISYFSKRYFRLVIPVLSSVLFAFLLLKLGLMYNHKLALSLGAPYVSGMINYFYDFTPNIVHAFVSGVFDTFFAYREKATYNPVLWTIQNEFLGSLFIFSLFGIVRHHTKRYILYLVIFLIIIFIKQFWLCSFLIGYGLCDYDFSDTKNRCINRLKLVEIKIHQNHSIILAVSLLSIILYREFISHINIPIDLYFLAISGFIIYVTLRNTYYQTFFSNKVLLWLGYVSFALYLLHFPILCSLTSYLILLDSTLQGKLIASLLSTIVILLLSFLYTKYIDRGSIILANKTGDYFKKYGGSDHY